MSTDEDEARVENAPEDVTYCARHPHVETVLRCGRCNTPICPRCLIQTPVGARCPTCANVSRLPTVDVPLPFLARGLAGALLAGAATGWFWGYLINDRGIGLFFLIFAGIGLGWAVSEAISLATNRKRGSALKACAIAGVVLAFFVHNIVAGLPLLPQNDLMGYLTAGIAAFFAASRLGP